MGPIEASGSQQAKSSHILLRVCWVGWDGVDFHRKPGGDTARTPDPKLAEEKFHAV